MKCLKCGQEKIPESKLKSIHDVKEELERTLNEFCVSPDNTQCTTKEFTRKMKKCLIEMGHKNNFYVHPEYYYVDNGNEKRIDFALFERNADILTGGPTIVIEHEQGRQILDEVMKLIKFNAKYKVIIGWEDIEYGVTKKSLFEYAIEHIQNEENKWCIAIGCSKKSKGNGYEPVKPGTFTYWPFDFKLEKDTTRGT